jgi:hypothetical protein
MRFKELTRRRMILAASLTTVLGVLAPASNASADPIDQCVLDTVGIVPAAGISNLNPRDPAGALDCIPTSAVTVDHPGIDDGIITDPVDHATGIQHNYCDDEWSYTVSKYTLEADHQVGPTIRNLNGGAGATTMTFESEAGHTLGWSNQESFSVSGGVSWGVIQAGIEQATQDNVTDSETTIQKSTDPIHVPQGWYGVGKYNIWTEVTDGEYKHLDQNCVMHDYGNVHAVAPAGEGWNAYASQSGR